jgi:hypothetical protein
MAVAADYLARGAAVCGVGAVLPLASGVAAGLLEAGRSAQAASVTKVPTIRSKCPAPCRQA